MKATLSMGTLCALFTLVNGAGAQNLSELERQAYDVGWSAANEYCQSLIPGNFRALEYRFGGRVDITEQFKRACKAGYDNYIDNNLSCQTRLRETNKYTEMWKARNDTCT
jgi:hypothetical protein